LPFASPGDLSDPGIEPMSPALAGRFFTTEPPEKPFKRLLSIFYVTSTVAGPGDELLNKTCYHEAYIHGPVVAMTRQCVNYLIC